jgi:hypothetical protein
MSTLYLDIKREEPSFCEVSPPKPVVVFNKETVKRRKVIRCNREHRRAAMCAKIVLYERGQDWVGLVLAHPSNKFVN